MSGSVTGLLHVLHRHLIWSTLNSGFGRFVETCVLLAINLSRGCRFSKVFTISYTAIWDFRTLWDLSFMTSCVTYLVYQTLY